MADDEQQALLDILAFIDTSSLVFGADDDASVLLPLVDDAELSLGIQSEASSTQSTAITADGCELEAQTKKVYARRNPREQIAQLKGQAARLEERLTLLRRRQSHVAQRALPYQPRLSLPTNRAASIDVSEDGEPPCYQWIDKALVEFEKRVKSEELNAYLKSTLIRHLRVSKALNSIIHADDEVSARTPSLAIMICDSQVR